MQLRLRFCVCILTLFLWPAPARPDCGAVCASGSCTFDGILNTPLGAADVSLDASCHLVVGGIGSGLVDGVVQSGLSSVYMVTSLATPNFSGSILGTRADIRQVGTANGQAGSEISLTRIQNVTGSLLRMDMDCGAIQVATYSTEIYDNGALVYQQTPRAETPILLFPPVDIEAMACALLPDGELYTTVRFGSTVPVTLQTLGGNLGPFMGSCVKLRGYAPAIVPTLQQAIENRFKDTGPVSITALFAGALPASTDAVCPDAPVPTISTTWGRLKAHYR